MARKGSTYEGAGGFPADDISIVTEGDNLFGDDVRRGHGMDPRARKLLVCAVVLAAMYAVAPFVPSGLFQNATLAGVIESVGIRASGMSALLAGSGEGEFSQALAAFAVIVAAGAGLALSGAVYQGAFRNALVSPSTLGVMSGAQVGMVLWVTFFYVNGGGGVFPAPLEGIASGMDAHGQDSFWFFCMAVASFVGCMGVVGLVLLTMRAAGARKASGVMMIITGQVIASIVGAVVNAIRYYFISTLGADSDKVLMLTSLLVQSFYRTYTWVDVLCIALPLAITFAVVMHLRQRMMILSFSEAEARAMGVDARRMQVAVVSLCTLLTAVIVSFCGAVGFVGFLVPHLARRLVGPSFKYLLPCSALVGGAFVLGAYLLLRMLGFMSATYTGVFISMAGGVVFLVTAIRGKGAGLGRFR